MTDRIKGVWVAFEEDIRIDDAQPILDAIRQLRGVAAVEPSISNSNDWINRVQIQTELEGKIWKALRAKPDKPR